MAVRTTNVGETIVNGAGVAQSGVTVTATLLPPPGDSPMRDLNNEVIDTLSLTAVTDNTGAYAFDPAGNNGLIAPGDITPTGATWQISYLDTVLISPSFAYTASTIAPSSWAPATPTTGLIRMYLTLVEANATAEQAASIKIGISADAIWSGGSGSGQAIDAGAQIPLSTDSSGNIYVYVPPTSQLNPTTTAYTCVLPSGTVLYFTAPAAYTGTDRGAYAGGTTYALNDIVEVSGVPYQSLQSANTGHSPASSPTWWAAYAGEKITAHLTTITNAGQIALSTAGIAHDSNVPALADSPVTSPATLSDDLRNLAVGLGLGFRVVTGATTLNAVSDDWILADASGGAFTIKLPAASARTRPFWIIRRNGGANAVTIQRGDTPGTDTINGAVTLSLGTQYLWAVLTSDRSGAYYAQTTSGGGSGTVTSVGLAVPAELTVGGSPVTGAGTITIGKATQSANTVWAGPTSGAAAAPGFRALIGQDLPAATVSSRGGVRVDGSSITISGDVISASGAATDATTTAVGAVEVEQNPASGHPRALTQASRGIDNGLAAVGTDGMLSSMAIPLGGQATGAVAETARWVVTTDLFGGAGSVSAQEPNAIVEGGKIRLWFTRDTSGTTYLAYTECSGDPTVSGNWASPTKVLGAGGSSYSGTVEHCSVTKIDGTYYCYFADNNNGNLKRSTSADGTTWATPVTVIASNQVGWSAGWNNSYVWQEGYTWYMLLEGANGSGLFLLTIATSADGLAWTFPTSGFIASLQPAGTGTTGGPWMMYPQKRHGAYHLYYHGSNNGSDLPTDIYHATATSPTGSWTIKNSGSAVIAHTGSGIDQYADPCVVEFNGNTYLFFERVNNGANDFRVCVAAAGCGVNQLLDGTGLGLVDPTTTEGDLLYRHSGVLIRAVLGSGLSASVSGGVATITATATGGGTRIAMQTGSSAPPIPLWSSDGKDYVYLSQGTP